MNLTLSPSKLCSEQQVAQQAQFVQQQTGNLSAVWAEGLTLHVVGNTAHLPVLNSTTGQQGEMHSGRTWWVVKTLGSLTCLGSRFVIALLLPSRCTPGLASSRKPRHGCPLSKCIQSPTQYARHSPTHPPTGPLAAGTMLLHSKGTNSTCTHISGASSGAAPDASSSGGTPGWVWAIVAVAAAAVAAACVGTLLWRRRRNKAAPQASADVEAKHGQLGKQDTLGGSGSAVIVAQHNSDQTNSGAPSSSEGLPEAQGNGSGTAGSLWKAR